MKGGFSSFPFFLEVFDAEIVPACLTEEGCIISTRSIRYTMVRCEARAPLLSMLQSCSVLAVVNIDAGFVAGAFAARVANLAAAARKQA